VNLLAALREKDFEILGFIQCHFQRTFLETQKLTTRNDQEIKTIIATNEKPQFKIHPLSCLKILHRNYHYIQ
jgi:hypothetical protein